MATKLVGYDPKLGKFTRKQLQEDTRAVIAGEKKVVVTTPKQK